jgi:hypothetical protein
VTTFAELIPVTVVLHPVLYVKGPDGKAGLPPDAPPPITTSTEPHTVISC